MAHSIAFAVALFVCVGLLFALLFIVAVLVLGGIHYLYDRLTKSDDEATTDQFVFWPPGLTKVIVSAFAIAAIPPVPIAIWGFEQIGWSAPWLLPPTTAEYQQEIAKAKAEYDTAIQTFKSLTKGSQEELAAANQELQTANAALETTRRLINEELETIRQPETKYTWEWLWPYMLTYVAGVVQSAIGSALYAKWSKA